MSNQISITVYGRVQGVFFRASTKKKADELGISGSVRNQENGTVLIIARGPEDKIEELLVWCRTGPPLARIDKLQVKDDDSPIAPGFGISH